MSLTKCRAIVIRTIQYSENSVVLKCYTDTHGMQSFMVNGVRSRKGAIRPSHLMPLNLLELEITHHENRSMQRIKELRCQPQLKSIHYDMNRNAVGTFMTELIYRSVKEEHHMDEALFSFLFNAIQILDLDPRCVPNFPVYFMLQLTRYLGFYPRGAYQSATNGFDVKEGSFTGFDARNPFQVDPVLSAKMSLLLAADFEAISDIGVTRNERTKLIDHLVVYFREHINGFTDMKSHLILGEVLA